jgi:hypothetical protein
MKKFLLPALCLSALCALTVAEKDRQKNGAAEADIALLKMQAENALCVSSRTIMQSLIDNKRVLGVSDKKADEIEERLDEVGQTNCVDEQAMRSYFALSGSFGAHGLITRLDGAPTHFGEIVNYAKDGLDNTPIGQSDVQVIFVRLMEDQRAVFQTFLGYQSFGE